MTWRCENILDSDCVSLIEHKVGKEKSRVRGREMLSGNWPHPCNDDDEDSSTSDSNVPGAEESLELSEQWDDPSPTSSDDEDSLGEVKISFVNDVSPLMSVPVPPILKKQPPPQDCPNSSFAALRCTYLLVTLVIMLADGLQGTHLYVLYEGYGYSVASLYCLGFLTGGLMSPITGPLVDRIGRKKAAILYCLLEIFINQLEQYPLLVGLIASRMIGGFTTNLLNSVFETWLDTEYRRRKLEKEKYEIIMRDSVIVSNLAAIFSGYLAHVLAENFGARGPFRGAVLCTTIALVVVSAVWTENYGDMDCGESKGMRAYLSDAVSAFKADNKMLRIGAIQGLTAGSIQIFIFLWSPALAQLAQSASSTTWGIDSHDEPAYGLIFGSFMAAGVLGGLIAPTLRRTVSQVISPVVEESDDISVATVEVDGEEIHIRPMAVEFLAATCYFTCALLLLVPCMYTAGNPLSFSACLAAFLVFEFLIGIFLPCEGVIRSLYFPANGRASVMALPRIIVNGAVSMGVASTNFVSLKTAFASVATLMVISAVLQLSLVSRREWSSLLSRLCLCRDSILSPALSLSRSTIRPFWESAYSLAIDTSIYTRHAIFSSKTKSKPE